MTGEKPTYAELEARVRELEERCSLLAVGLASFFVEAPAGLAVFDRECRYVMLNQTLADFAGRSVADHLGRTLSEMIPTAVGAEAEAGLRRVLATGEAILNREIRGEMPGRPGVVRHWLHSQFPIHDGRQGIVGVGAVVVETTAIKELLDEATRRESFQRMLLTTMPQRVFMKDVSGTYLYCNENFAREMGTTPDRIAGKSDYDLFPAAYAEKYRADDQRVMASGKPEELEEEYLAGGEKRFAHTTKAAVFSGRGEVIGLLGIYHDITARKRIEAALADHQAELERQVLARTTELRQRNALLLEARAELERSHDAMSRRVAERTRDLEVTVDDLAEAVERQARTEEKLRESEERLRQIAESISSVVWIRDLPAERILYVSPAYETLWGRSCESLYEDSASWLNSIHPEDRERVRVGHLPSRAAEESVEYRLARANGEVRWVRAKIFVVRDQAGMPYREVGIAEDVTACREMFERLQESEQRYRSLFDSSIDGISITTAAGDGKGKRLLDCNESYLALAGRERAELLAAPTLKGFKDYHERFSAGASLVPSPDGSCRGVYSWQRPDRRRNFVECRGIPVRIDGIACMHCLHRDVTAARAAEERIRDLSRRVFVMAEEERKRIARDLHDDFGQHLLAMRHGIDVLQERFAVSGEAEPPELARIGGQIEALASAVRRATNNLRSDLLDNLGFVPALEQGMKDFADSHPSLRTSLSIVGTPGKVVPECESVLYRVFQEGLTNIGKHARAKSVSVRLVHSYPSLILVVADDGVGFAPASLAGCGGGIGLRGMRERVLAIGGTLSIRSRPGEGTMLRAEVASSCG